MKQFSLAASCGVLLLTYFLLRAPAPVPAQPPLDVDRSPVDVLLTPDEKHLLTANQTANTVSLVNVESGKVVAEVPCGKRPSALALTPDGKQLLVSGTYSGELTIFALAGDKLTRQADVQLGFEPRGIAVAPDGKLAYVALTTAHVVAIVDLEKRTVLARIAVGKWPRYLALTADGKRLAVGCSGDGGVAVVDTAERKLLFLEDFVGMNLGDMQIAADGKHVWFPFMVYRQQPITANNIRIGWVMASRLGRVRLDAKARREAVALDPPGKAVSDPHGLALSPDEQWVVTSASGTHELLVFRTAELPLQDYGGSDHIPPALLKDENRFFRVPVGGRPMAVRFAKDGQRVFVANYLLNAIQVVHLTERKVARTIELGGPKEPSLARRGEAIFHDGQRSLDQWYSCHSCHYEGHTNSLTIDTRNDGRNGNYKVVLSLRNVTRTGPWTWHGWQKDIQTAMTKSLTDSMLGPQPAQPDVDALVAYLDTLRPPPNPHAPSEATQRGKLVFESAKAGCARCHSDEYFTDGKIHDVGLGVAGDAYRGFNTPSLLGVYDRLLYLHDGRSRSLEELLKGPHSPAKVTRKGELTAAELAELVEYLKSL